MGISPELQRLPAPDETNLLVESYPHGWFWNIPLHNGWMSVGAVVDSQTGQEGMRHSSPQRFLIEQITQAPYTRQMLQEANLAYGPFVIKDWSYVSDEVVGDGYILVGDAACFVDPLFSSGVHLALMAGVLAAAYVTTALKDPSMRDAAGRVYKDLVLQGIPSFSRHGRVVLLQQPHHRLLFLGSAALARAMAIFRHDRRSCTRSRANRHAAMSVWCWNMARRRPSSCTACGWWNPSGWRAVPS